MFHVILFQPEIPPNTGNIIRLCANTGCHLHLIEPLGFRLDDRELRRAGLDYHEYAAVKVYPSLEQCLENLPSRRVFPCSTRGKKNYAEKLFQPDDIFLFGPETRGLPLEILQTFDPEVILRIPMLPNNRSLNLSNCVAVMVYEAWRQCQFAGATY